MEIGAFVRGIDLSTGELSPPVKEMVRTLGDMKGCYAVEGEESTVVYRVLQPEGQMSKEITYAVTVLMPGKVGNEYFMTKGHFHKRPEAGEIYLCLRGEGLVLLQSRLGLVETAQMRRGSIVHVPPGTAHRTINTGSENMIFIAFYSPDAGHDYESVTKSGFAKRVVEVDGRAELVDR
ncbi:MAG: glucose-6-phosphate isomerase family protein [Candidatus Thermoplasmatota archaeon]